MAYFYARYPGVCVSKRAIAGIIERLILTYLFAPSKPNIRSGGEIMLYFKHIN